MKLTSPNYVRDLLVNLDLKPGKSLGQNFLVDGNILKIILGHADISPDDFVLEIGPGLGVLTEAALERAEKVLAVEKDLKLYNHLEELFAGDERLDLLHSDALDLDLDATLGQGISKVVSNLPYSVASRILVEIFKSANKPQRIVVTLQTDVAERIAAPPDCKQYGLMAVLAQRFYEVEIVKKIGRNCFIPRPRVESALLLCKLRDQPLVSVADEEFFLRLVKMTFTHRRKMLVNALRGAGFNLEEIVRALCEATIDEQLRPAQLGITDWGNLSNALMNTRTQSQ